MTTNSTKVIKIFYCYAFEDRILRDELEKHLSPLKRLRQITGWFDRDILAGTDWEQEIETQLNAASIILILISPDFIFSDYCYGIEMQRALERHKTGNAHIIPIILRPVYWEETPLYKLNVLPTTGKPITLWADRDEALLNVTLGISNIVKALLAKETLSQQETSIFEQLGSPIQSSIKPLNKKIADDISFPSLIQNPLVLKGSQQTENNISVMDTEPILVVNAKEVLKRVRQGNIPSTWHIFKPTSTYMPHIIIIALSLYLLSFLNSALIPFTSIILFLPTIILGSWSWFSQKRSTLVLMPEGIIQQLTFSCQVIYYWENIYLDIKWLQYGRFVILKQKKEYPNVIKIIQINSRFGRIAPIAQIILEAYNLYHINSNMS